MVNVLSNISHCPDTFQRIPYNPPTDLHIFSDILKICLEFCESDKLEHNIDSINPQKLPNKDVLELRKSLTVKFFSKLFVDRVEIEYLRRFIDSNRPFIVEGYVGVGKSSLLRKFHSQYCPIDYTIFFDFLTDLEQIPVVLKNGINSPYDIFSESLTSDDQRIFNRFLDILYTFINQKFFVSDILIDQLRYNRILLLSKFEEFREELIDLYSAQFGSFDSIIKLLNRTDVHSLYKKHNQNKKVNYIEQLRIALHVLNKNDIRPIIIIDNIDRNRIPLQIGILNLVDDFTANRNVSTSFFISFRRENLFRITGVNREHQEARFSATRSSAVILTAISEGRFQRVETGEQLVLMFLKRRLDFAKNYINNNSALLSKIDAFFISNYNMRISDVLNHIWTNIYALTNNKTISSIIKYDLNRWHNGSLRAISIHIKNLIFMFVDGHEKDYSIIEGIEKIIKNAVNPDSVNPRKFRSMLYRHMILDLNVRSGIHSPKTLAWCNYMTEEKETGELNFLRLRILLYIYNTKSEVKDKVFQNGCKMMDIYETFKLFGVTTDEITRHVQYLSARRGYDPNGLIYIDALTDNMGQGEKFEYTTYVTLLPSGQYYVERLFRMVEIIFWSIMYIERAGDNYRISAKELKNEDNYYNEEWKVKHVVKFIKQHVAKKLEEEAVYYTNLMRTDMEGRYYKSKIYWNKMNKVKESGILASLIGTIERFCREAKINSTEINDGMKEIRKINQRIESRRMK